MAKYDSSNTEEIKTLRYNGDVYYIYHIKGLLVSVEVKYDGERPTPVEWVDLPPSVQQIIDDTINFNATE